MRRFGAGALAVAALGLAGCGQRDAAPSGSIPDEIQFSILSAQGQASAGPLWQAELLRQQLRAEKDVATALRRELEAVRRQNREACAALSIFLPLPQLPAFADFFVARPN